MLTASTHLVIPTLIGRGLTEDAARATLKRARLFGRDTAQVGSKLVHVSYQGGGKFTIGGPRVHSH